jgi:hypothetical protein
MHVILEGLAGLSWLAGVVLLLLALASSGFQGAYNIQVATACFLCGIFLILYVRRPTE